MTRNLELLQRELHLVLLSKEERPVNPGAILSEYNNRLTKQACQIQEQSEFISQQSQQVRLLSENSKNSNEQINRKERIIALQSEQLGHQLSQIHQLLEQASIQTELITQLKENIQQHTIDIRDLSLKITEQNNRLIDLSASNTSCLNIIQVKELHIQSLVSSWTWKVGKVILWPARFIFLKIVVPVNAKIQARLKTPGHL